MRTILYHASREIVEHPEIRKVGYQKDFSWGFYCANDIDQAKRWAIRRDSAGGKPTINFFEYKENASLAVKKFPEMSDEWLDFIANCRSGKQHGYDIVEGPMANDTVWNYVNDYLAGNITRKQFWALAEFKHPTHQISFNTNAALACLEYKKSEVVQWLSHP